MPPHPIYGTVHATIDLTDFGKNPLFRQIYHSYLYMTLVSGIPFVALAVLNACLVRAVRASSRRGREISADVRKRNDTTIMLIGVVAVFFVCQTPALVSNVIWAFAKQPTSQHLGLYVLNEVGTLMVVVNASVNIVPYYFFGKRFRNECLQLFVECVQRRPAHWRSAITQSQSVISLATVTPKNGQLVVAAPAGKKRGGNHRNASCDAVSIRRFSADS